jgi:ATP-binding cassette, subfamily C, bacteriocin exporter
MNKLHHIRRCFVRQLTHNDCGLACISMILNYAGKKHDLSRYREKALTGADGSSLLELKNLLVEFGIPARCVEMDIEFLRNITAPVILHTMNENGQNHFQVCFRAIKKKKEYYFLVADPAKQIYYLSEKQLAGVWQSRAAIYFVELHESPGSEIKSPWIILLSLNLFPRGLLIAVPFLNLCSVGLGIAVSWVLQKGLNDSPVGKKSSLIIGTVILLLIVTLSRSLFSYTRQRILILLGNAVNEQLVISLIKKIVHNHAGRALPGDKAIKNSMVEIQKIQNALSVFVATLLSDGSLILLILSATFYTLPVVGFINLGYLITATILTVKGLPVFLFDYAHLNELAGATENYMVRESRFADIYEPAQEENRIRFHQDNHKRYLDFAHLVAAHFSKMNLLLECLGTLSVMLALSLAFVKLQQQMIDYGSFMVLVILSYFITSLMQKIGNALVIIADGAEASVLFKSRVGGD